MVGKRTLPSPIDSMWSFLAGSPAKYFPNLPGLQMDSRWTLDTPPGVHGVHSTPPTFHRKIHILVDSTWTPVIFIICFVGVCTQTKAHDTPKKS